MTIASSVNKHIYTGDGVTKDWPYTFQILTNDGSDIRVYLTDTVNDVITQITSYVNIDTANSIVAYPVSGEPITAKYKLTIIREEALTQNISLLNQGAYFAKTVERGLDKLTAITQQLAEKIARSVQLPIDNDGGGDELLPAILESVTSAVNSAAIASTKAAEASASAMAAASSETNASSSESAAEFAAAIASTKAAEASASAMAAASSETNASSSESAAEFAAAIASTKAAEASASAMAAASSETNAAGSESAASASAMAAANSAHEAAQNAVLAKGVLPGMSIDYWGDSPPEGFLYENGAEISRLEFADLFATIGTTFGVGDGSTTFNIPDSRDRFKLSIGASYTGIGDTGGAATHILTIDQIPSHSHTYTAYQAARNTNDQGSHVLPFNPTSGASTGARGGGQAHNNMPPYIICLPCIKY